MAGDSSRGISKENPLLGDAPEQWDRLIEAVGPAGMIVAIAKRMSAGLRDRVHPDDVWQETLLHAWRDRARCEWKGIPALRRWLLSIAENRIRDFADRENAEKRGSGRTPARLSFSSPAGDGSRTSFFAGPAATTTPSRVAIDRETAARMEAALDAVPDDQREVVRLRLFEDLTMEEVARRVGVGVEAARHRFRKGVRTYWDRFSGQSSSLAGSERDGAGPIPLS